MKPVSRGIDRIAVTFDEPNLVANAGLLMIGTLVGRLGLERLINATLRFSGRVGGAAPEPDSRLSWYQIRSGRASRDVQVHVPRRIANARGPPYQNPK